MSKPLLDTNHLSLYRPLSVSNALTFTLLTLLFVTFAVVIGLVVLRFTTVISHLRQSDSQDRAVLFRELDASHVTAFGNAMTALERVSDRIADSQMAAFTRTMDTIHGPQRDEAGTGEYKVDDPKLDSRPAWYPDDDSDRAYIYADPTDALEPDPDPSVNDPDRDNGYAVSVRPGEGLLNQ